MTTTPVQITFRNMRSSTALEQEILSRVEWLASFHPAIVGCRVVLETPHRHRVHDRPVHVRIELSLPGEDVVITHEPSAGIAALSTVRKSHQLDGRNKTAQIAVRDAFDAARRSLQDQARRQRGDIKTHEALTQV